MTSWRHAIEVAAGGQRPSCQVPPGLDKLVAVSFQWLLRWRFMLTMLPRFR